MRGKFSDTFVLVDEDNYEKLNKFTWYCRRSNHTRKDGSVCIDLRPMRVEGPRNARKYIYMVHDILPKKQGVEIDHKNRNTLDNRRCNLRYATSAQNKYNRAAEYDSSTKIKGVQVNRIGKWNALIRFNGKRLYLGNFTTKEEAGNAYNKASIKLHKEFSYKNAN